MVSSSILLAHQRTGNAPTFTVYQNPIVAPTTVVSPIFPAEIAPKRSSNASDVAASTSLPSTLPFQGDTEAAKLGLTQPGSRTSPEPSQTDRQGHYVGPASGVSFLPRVQKRLHQSIEFGHAASTIFTFGDVPLPEFEPVCFMPSKEETSRLLRRYFDFSVPVDRFLHRRTVEEWLDEFYDTAGSFRNNQEEAPARTALLFMIFALAQDLLDPQPNSETTDMSIQYFLAADHQLSRERGVVRLVSVQARLCQCLWLLSRSRINHCWSLFGTTAHLALAIGLNRNRHADPAAGVNYVEIECQCRTFWAGYCLGSYLSTALGRPRTFHDDDIDQELPSCVDDRDIYRDRSTPSTSPEQTLMYAPVAYFRLSRIVSGILRDLHSIRPCSSADRYAFVAGYSEKLKAWRTEMSSFLNPDISPALLLPIFHRQRNVLNLAYWHTVVLTHRPFLLSKFAQLQHKRLAPHASSHQSQIDNSIRECLQAAMNITHTVDSLVRSGQMFQAYWFTSYFAFSSVVVLYVYTIQERLAPVETYLPYLNAATHCQNQISKIAEKGSLAARYCLVLEELRKEACRQIERAHAIPVSDDGAVIASDGAVFYGNGNNFSSGDHFAQFHLTPGSSLGDVTDWAPFDAMVTPDFGGLETLLSRDGLMP
ncbi:hypothetical protein A1O7_01805 [Cladophialophora yegresii CBS 114405]|uniref:Xylanolytic transcriptional activator regulatory domain-containing protein n=1 Tax=Cladophialophora yegresii CBS 114405 TaxID=1182544 RepID=W9X4T8_9EURO|nr:uncharacterized protein A1O7_01805 [Cladophialophora yegresii CBS 114405]EXJ65464.1 hypothetical protein A1O7_01805 [Cladophialophora yegresii CBS 114405]